MSDFDGLDLQAVEDQMAADEETGGSHRVVLGVLDGTTDDINALASGFARPVKEAGGDLMHFRGFLIVTPPTVSIDKSRLES